jgi:hypothetical protein
MSVAAIVSFAQRNCQCVDCCFVENHSHSLVLLFVHMHARAGGGGGGGECVLLCACRRPFSAITYTSFSMYERALVDKLGPDSPVSYRFMAGSLAGATATVATYPLDLVRARIAAHWSIVPRCVTSTHTLVASFQRQLTTFAQWHSERRVQHSCH